ncbi:MAG: PAS domain-containing sensor histidine kinase [Ignavibacteriales bacterium]|nr:PAS domain-containing sensor histidine kinase [Ignavibacteriales bacterium]
MQAVKNSFEIRGHTLQHLVNEITNPVIITLAEGVITNNTFATTFSVPKNNGASQETNFPDLYIESVDEVIAELNSFTEVTLAVHSPAEPKRWIIFKKSNLGGIILYSGFEITPIQNEYDLLKNSEERLSGFFNNLGEAIFVVENQYPDYPVVSVNEAFLNYCKLLKADVLGQNICSLVFNDLREQLFMYLFLVCSQDKPVCFDAVSHDGKTKKFFTVNLVSKSRGTPGENIVIGSISDTTERKNTVLELEETRQKAEMFNNLKASFLANLSHEIRTPLNGINGFAEMLHEELHDEWYKKVVRRILASSGRLLSTLNALIDLSRLEAENLVPKKARINFMEFVQSLVPEYEALVTAKGLAFVTEIPSSDLAIETDTYLLKSILDKIIDNAIKYTASGSVALSISNDDKYVYAHVKDSGIGIAIKDQPVIFEEFWQVTAGMERSHEGLGIGLTLAKKMLHLMKGEILVSSTPGEGSTFTVKYPVGTG